MCMYSNLFTDSKLPFYQTFRGKVPDHVQLHEVSCESSWEQQGAREDEPRFMLYLLPQEPDRGNFVAAFSLQTLCNKSASIYSHRFVSRLWWPLLLAFRWALSVLSHVFISSPNHSCEFQFLLLSLDLDS